MSRLLGLLRRGTADAWRAIDAEFPERGRPSWEVAIVLVVAAVALIIERYYGGAGGMRAPSYAKGLLSVIPYSSLRPRAYWAGFKLVTGFMIPAACIWLVIRGRLRDHGWTLRGEARGLRLAFILLAVVLPVIVAASYTTQFQQTYPRYSGAGRSMNHLALWFVAYGFQFLMLEFFFRGFLLFSLARHFGSSAIFITVVPYAMIHFGKPLAETFGSIAAGIALATLALRTRSIAGGVVIHCGAAFAMDLLGLAHSGRLSALFRGG
ncbi:MAG: type II CAAX endopeptidase family protein [Myxococcota bacterium]